MRFVSLLSVAYLIGMQVLIANTSFKEEYTFKNHDCQTHTDQLESPLYCRGVRAIRNIINNLNKIDRPIVLVRGLEIVPSKRLSAPLNGSQDIETNQLDLETADTSSSISQDESLLGKFANYLRNHEINLKFSDLMSDEASDNYLAQDLLKQGVELYTSVYQSEARKKDRGNGMLMMMGVMFSKLMALIGLGSVGALAMKALGVAMIALTVAGIIGIRALGAGGQDAHSVQYVTSEGSHHKRRRRSSIDRRHTLQTEPWATWNSQNMAYKAWQK